MRFSIVVPVYEVVGGANLLFRNLKSINEQSFKDLEVVVPDNSENNNLKQVTTLFPDLKINHFFSDHRGMAQNTNNGIKASKGDLIKFLYMDDFFAHADALETIDFTMGKYNWLATGCNHYDGEHFYTNHFPSWNKDIHRGINTIGSPSVITVVNKDPLLFDEKMTWMLDCDYYRRLQDRYGTGEMIDDINVTIGIGEFQTTHWLNNDIKLAEERYILDKYK